MHDTIWYKTLDVFLDCLSTYSTSTNRMNITLPQKVLLYDVCYMIFCVHSRSTKKTDNWVKGGSCNIMISFNFERLQIDFLLFWFSRSKYLVFWYYTQPKEIVTDLSCLIFSVADTTELRKYYQKTTALRHIINFYGYIQCPSNKT